MVHDCSRCEVFKRTYELAFVLRFVPQARVLLTNNQLIDLGSLVFATFKNSLLVELYLDCQLNYPQSMRAIGSAEKFGPAN